jgi:hypothetical protein
LAKQIQDRGKQLHDLQAKHRALLHKLGEHGAVGAWEAVPYPPYANWSYSVTSPAPAVATVPAAPPAMYYRNVAPRATPAVPPATTAPPNIAYPAATPVPTPPHVMLWETTPSPKPSSDDWERRLDRLTKEIQDLRRELQREKQPSLQRK